MITTTATTINSQTVIRSRDSERQVNRVLRLFRLAQSSRRWLLLSCFCICGASVWPRRKLRTVDPDRIGCAQRRPHNEQPEQLSEFFSFNRGSTGSTRQFILLFESGRWWWWLVIGHNRWSLLLGIKRGDSWSCDNRINPISGTVRLGYDPSKTILAAITSPLVDDQGTWRPEASPKHSLSGGAVGEGFLQLVARQAAVRSPESSPIRARSSFFRSWSFSSRLLYALYTPRLRLILAVLSVWQSGYSTLHLQR